MTRFKKKLLRYALMHACIYVINLNCFAQRTQVDLFNNFVRESWKSKKINIGGNDKTIEQHIVDAFNGSHWGPCPKNGKKINTTLNEDIKKYYDGQLRDSSEANKNYNPQNPETWLNDLATDDSPRQWLKKLDLREIYRFKKYIDSLRNHSSDPVDLIDNRNYNTDDLVKARALCGIFVIHDGTSVYGYFSGMLDPGQAFGSSTYFVHTCMHGFRRGNGLADGRIITYYFVPYGVPVNDIPGDQDNAAQKGFKVRSIKQGGQLTSIQLDGAAAVAATTPATLYNQNDYAIVTIEKNNADGTSLYDILKSANNVNPIGAAIKQGEKDGNQITNLPNINEVDGLQINTDSNFDPATEKLFIIGRAPDVSCALDNRGLAICIMLKNEALSHNENRSSENNENVQDPPHKVNINTLNESFSSLPSYPGMSGGVILRCKMSPDGRKNCAFIGTNWGSERIFNGNQLKGLGHFINKQ